MKRVNFLKENFNEQLKESGYCIFDLLSRKRTLELAHLYHKVNSEVGDRFFSSSHLQNKELVNELSDACIKIISPELEKQLSGYNVLGAALLSKPPGSNSKLPIHQDWNIVDEKVSRSYNLWIPLVDVSEINGAMIVLKGSHGKELTLRGKNIPSRFQNVIEELKPNMETISMNVGQALLYDHALIHGSPENFSSTARNSIVCGIVPEGSALRLYQGSNEIINEYEVSRDFLVNHISLDISGNHDAKLLETYPMTDQISQTTFESLYLGKNSSIYSKIKSKYLSWI